MIPSLTAWESFYIIVGSSAGALTGLQFVVIALVAESGQPSSGREIAAFGTPTVVHFCSSLFVAAILSAPWHALSSAGLAIGACGLAGIVYAAIVVRRARMQKGYKPVFEDWVWHTILPALAYLSMLVAAARLVVSPTSMMFVIAGAALLLLFIGIHNAWDTVTYIAVERWVPAEHRSRGAEEPPRTDPLQPGSAGNS